METATHEIELPLLRDAGAHRDPSTEERLAVELEDRRQLLELAGAIREHQARLRGQVGSARAHDAVLYRRLRQIGGSS